MPVNMMCERCGRSMGTVTFQNMRDHWQKHGEVCRACTKMEEDMLVHFENMKKGYITRLDKQVDWAKKELAKWIKNKVEKMEVKEEK